MLPDISTSIVGWLSASKDKPFKQDQLVDVIMSISL